MYGISLYGGDPINRYNITYFSEAGKVDASQPFHYELDQAQDLKIQIGYLVLKEDVDNLVDVYNETLFSTH